MMKKRIFAVSCLCVLVLNLAGSAIGDVRGKRAGSPAAQLAALLPAVDGIATIDVKRVFSDALPKILAANQPMFQKITGAIDKLKADTGVDVRQFDHIAAGVTARKISDKNYDTDPVIIARGQVSSGALIGAAKVAANGKYREEKAGDKAIYVFASKELADLAGQQTPAAAGAVVDKAANQIAKEMAVAALDANTIVFGDVALVRQTISGRPAAASELLPLLAKKEPAIISFAGKMPAGMSSFMPLENDELGKNVDSIRFVYGGMDMAANLLTVNVTARTLQDAQAKSLLESLQGLQMLGKAFLGSAKGEDKQAYARMIDNARFSARANEVAIDLQVPQSDIDILFSKLK